MKKVFLHGGLGDRFGAEWTLDVQTPMEAFRALVANDPCIEKYLFDKQKDGVVYGFKSSPHGVFLGEGEGEVRTPGDLHVFAIPEGAGILGSLVMLAVSVAASIYIGKKFAEAMDRDETVAKAQTQSYIFQGKQNRFQQGDPVPLGYGRLIVGSNVISSTIVNYDFNSENGRIINFNSGLYSVVPTYSRYYIPALGPLGSSYILNAFDGVSQFKAVDPAFKAMSLDNPPDFFGGRETLYGGYVPIDQYRGQYTNAEAQRCTTEGNFIGGYFTYCNNFYKGLDVSLIANARVDGNWWPDPATVLGYNMPVEKDYAVAEVNTTKSSFVCLQSSPTLANSNAMVNSERLFYPTAFGGDQLTYLPTWTTKKNADGVFPIQVGQRWRNGNKKGGVGWFKLESVSIEKTIDLIGEGPIEGFSDSNGKTLQFKKTIENPTAELVSADGLTLRSTDDDYMRGIFLDNTPAKEVINAGTPKAQDSYNINEFDVDIGMNTAGEIGTEDQTLLEPQYLFTANTTSYGKILVGPRNTNVTNIGASDVELSEFVPNTPYKRGDLLTYTDADSSYKYRVQTTLNESFEEGSLYQSGDYVYKKQEATDLYDFYRGNENLDSYQAFSGQYVQNIRPYKDADEVRGIGFGETTKYYKFKASIDIFKGVYSEDGIYINGDIVQMPFGNSPNTVGQLFEITGGAVGEGIFLRSSPLYVEQNKTLPMEVLHASGHASEIDVSPTSTSQAWDEVKINSPVKGGVTIKGVADEDLRKALFILFASSDGSMMSKSNEEYYLTHTVINPLVEEVIASLGVDELVFTYPGDEIDVTYQLGLFWALVLGAIAIFEAAKGVAKGSMAGGLGTAATKLGATAFVAEGNPITAIMGPPIALAGGGLGLASAAAGVGSFLGGTFGLAVTLIAIIYVALKWWKVGTKVENSGETWPNRARFRIKYGNEGGLEYVTDINIYGVATSPYIKDVKLYLPPNPSQKDRTIKFYKINYERNPVKEGEMSARYKEKLSLGAVTEIVPTKLNYANSVVIGTRVNAKDVGSTPERTYNLKLKKVAIPSNYNPETRQYEGGWNGRFKGQTNTQDDPDKYWTDNPAWCLYDLMSNERYGVAKFGLRPENIDKWTLYKIAKYCDHQIPTGYSAKYNRRNYSILGGGVIKITTPGYESPTFKTEFAHVGKELALFYNDGTYDSIKIKSFSTEEKTMILEYTPEDKGGQCAVSIDYPILEPRYTFNGMLMSSQNAFKMINEMAAIFRTYAYWAGGAINFFQDEEKEPVMLFSNNNIGAEGFNYSSTPKTSRTNSCKIKYVDRYNQFRPKMENSQDTPSIRDNNIIEQSIDGFGITSPGQAKRATEFLVKTANTETEIISFNTSVIGSYLRPGDVVSVLDDKRTVGRFAGKVRGIKVSGDGKAAEIDIDFPVRTLIDPSTSSSWKTINLYSLSGNQTIGSLDSIAEGGSEVSDANIENLRARQIGQYWVSDISNNDTTLHLSNNPYSIVTGSYTWSQALMDADARGGILGTVNNSIDQGLIKAILPQDQVAWLGGYHRENPQPDEFVWYQPQDCTSNAISYFDWADGFPKVGDPLETDSDDQIVTDITEINISTDSPDGFGNYIAVSGSAGASQHGDWVTLSGVERIGYILEKKADNSLLELNGGEGTTFALEDSVNFANPDTYKVINITEESAGVFKIQGVQYNPEKFNNIEKDASLKAPESPLIFTEQAIDAPANVQLSLSYNNGYGITAVWDKVTGAAAYKIQFFNGTMLLATFEVESDISDSLNQSYSYRGAGIREGGEYFTRIYSLVR